MYLWRAEGGLAVAEDPADPEARVQRGGGRAGRGPGDQWPGPGCRIVWLSPDYQPASLRHC